MGKIQKKLFAFGIVALGLQGCATSAYDHAVTDKISQEPQVTSRANLQAETAQLLQKDPNLTGDQKAQLETLRNETRKQITKIGQNSLKLRSVMFKELLSENYSEAELKVIKKRLQKNENERLQVMFSAVEKANKILGRQAAVHQGYMNEMLEHSEGIER